VYNKSVYLVLLPPTLLASDEPFAASLQLLPYLIVAHVSPKPVSAKTAAMALVGAIPMAWMMGRTAAEAPAEAIYRKQLVKRPRELAG
jgi:hypothetical protein